MKKTMKLDIRIARVKEYLLKYATSNAMTIKRTDAMDGR